MVEKDIGEAWVIEYQGINYDIGSFSLRPPVLFIYDINTKEAHIFPRVTNIEKVNISLKGIGTKEYRELEQKAIKKGVKEVYGFIREDNYEEARDFWEKMKFKIIHKKTEEWYSKIRKLKSLILSEVYDEDLIYKEL